MTARVSRATSEQEMSNSAVDPSSFAPDTSSSSPVLALQPSQPVPKSQQEIFQHPHFESAEPGVDSEYESDARTFDGDAAQEVFDNVILSSPRRSTHAGRAVDGELQDEAKDGRCGCCTRCWVDCWVQ